MMITFSATETGTSARANRAWDGHDAQIQAVLTDRRVNLRAACCTTPRDRSRDAQMQIEIVGLERMGRNIAERLRAVGHGCVVHDLDTAAMAAQGATGAESLTVLVRQPVPGKKLLSAMRPPFGGRARCRVM